VRVLRLLLRDRQLHGHLLLLLLMSQLDYHRHLLNIWYNN
jgi:hypothetical protein